MPFLPFLGQDRFAVNFPRINEPFKVHNNRFNISPFSTELSFAMSTPLVLSFVKGGDEFEVRIRFNGSFRHVRFRLTPVAAANCERSEQFVRQPTLVSFYVECPLRIEFQSEYNLHYFQTL